MASVLVYSMWERREDPDNSAIPYLTALGDLLGGILLASVFHLLEILKWSGFLVLTPAFMIQTKYPACKVLVWDKRNIFETYYIYFVPFCISLPKYTYFTWFFVSFDLFTLRLALRVRQRAALFVSGRLLGAVNNIVEFSDWKLFLKYYRSLGIIGGCQATMLAEARSTRKERWMRNGA